MHVLGVDAGGSKTVCRLADETGRVIAEHRGPGANLQSAGEQALERVLRSVIEPALSAIGSGPDGLAVICLGMAGVDRPDDTRAVSRIVGHITDGARLLIVNDALVALSAGVGSAAGIVIVAGTGSIAYGRNARSEAARAGGWGHLIGDEGSGFWIGRRALAAVVRAADGRGPATRLTRDVLDHFGAPDPAALVHVVYAREIPRANVAAVAPIVGRAAAEGDAVARQVLERGAEELALAARSVATQLEMRGEPFSFVLTGSVFRLVPPLARELEPRLLEIAPRSQTALLTEEPAAGAVMLALAALRGTLQLPRYRQVRTSAEPGL